MICLHNLTGKGDGVHRIYQDVELELSRIWRCRHCGAKIYQKENTKRPVYSCLCGKYEWAIFRSSGLARGRS